MSVHVIQRGINKRDVFDENGDYEIFLSMVAEAVQKYGVKVHGFTVMKNHFHLQVTPESKLALPRAMQQLETRYCVYYNKKHTRMGTIWNGRYKPILIESERQWLTCLRYIELNPVRAGIVALPDLYPWSSFATHALGKPCEWLTGHPILESLGRTPFERLTAYRALCLEGLTNSDLTVQRYRIPVAAPR